LLSAPVRPLLPSLESARCSRRSSSAVAPTPQSARCSLLSRVPLGPCLCPVDPSSYRVDRLRKAPCAISRVSWPWLEIVCHATAFQQAASMFHVKHGGPKPGSDPRGLESTRGSVMRGQDQQRLPGSCPRERLGAGPNRTGAPQLAPEQVGEASLALERVDENSAHTRPGAS
jgi:hypothetical protein